MKPMVRLVRLVLIAAFALAATRTSLTPVESQERSAQPLVALFNTAGNLGFATIRAAFAHPDQPLSQAAADWMVKDYANAKQWGGALASCVAFDLTRLDTAAALVRNARASARDLWQVADQLHRDYRTAAGRASCTLGLPGLQQVDAFYLGALFMGFATARASYFYSAETPVPQAVVEQIGGDFATVRSGIKSAESCLGSTAPFDAQMDAAQRRLGVVPGKDSYNEVVAVYIAIETALKSSRCGGTSSVAPPPTPGGSCMQTACAAACQGAVILLGQVSGSPDCVACMSKNCR